jgi:nucleoside-diphosphate-sugar epimerase
MALRPLGFEIVNLGGDKPYKLIEFLHLVEKALGKKAKIEYRPFHPADMKATWADITKAKRLFDWKPTVKLAKGTDEAVSWFIEHQHWTKDIEL